MTGFIVSPAAKGDLEDIWDYLAIELEDPDTADHVIEGIFASFQRISSAPGIGHFRSDLCSQSVRFWSVWSYLVVYRHEGDEVQIVRVVHASRDVKALLAD